MSRSVHIPICPAASDRKIPAAVLFLIPSFAGRSHGSIFHGKTQSSVSALSALTFGRYPVSCLIVRSLLLPLLLLILRKSAVLVCLILALVVCTSKSAASERGHMSPLYFGPNALPVPDMLNIHSRTYIELAYDHFFGYYGDQTETIFARVHIPLFTPRINLSIWMPVVEFYQNTPESFAHFQPEERKWRGWEPGNVCVSMDILVFKERRFLPAMSFRAAFITASGDGDQYSRNFDAPGYFFDAAFSKTFVFDSGFFESLRLAVSGGFMCWQVSRNTQNDAYMYGAQAVLDTRLLEVSFAWQGYSGWIGNGDRPMVLKTGLTFKAGHFLPLLVYEYGLRDYPYHHLRTGLAYQF